MKFIAFTVYFYDGTTQEFDYNIFESYNPFLKCSKWICENKLNWGMVFYENKLDREFLTQHKDIINKYACDALGEFWKSHYLYDHWIDNYLSHTLYKKDNKLHCAKCNSYSAAIWNNCEEMIMQKVLG